MIRHDYAPKMFPRPWYVAPLYFLSCVVMAYALLWLVELYVDTGDCWAMADSAGCMVVLKP